VKINVLIPFLGRTGGIAVALEHARGLRALGHDVAVYYPLLPYGGFLFEEKSWFRKWILGRLKPLLGNIVRGRRNVDWAGPDAPVIPVLRIGTSSVRDADAVIATAWPTAYDAAALPARKGARLYFIQHYEVWSSDPARVDGSYRLPVHLVPIAPWLTALMAERFGRKVLAEVHNGLDTAFFNPPESPRDFNRPSLLMMHHALEWKGVREGMAVLAAVHARHPDIPIRLFGLGPFPDCPPWAEYHRDPSPDALRDLYRTCTLFLSPSHLEGWGLTPMEALACGAAVVATRTGWVPLLDDGTCLVAVEPKDSAALEAAVEGLIRDPAKAASLAAKGQKEISRFTWARSTKRLEEALEAAVAGAQAGKEPT
jgi:glycosyltransferase involved in cell wall biosynthesis